MSTELPPRRPGQPAVKSMTFDDSPVRSLVSGIRRCVRIGGLGRIATWLAVAALIALALDLALGLPPAVRAALVFILAAGALLLALLFLIHRPGKITMNDATRELETAHPEFGQMLRTARDSSVEGSAVSPVLRNELFRRAAIHLAGLDLKKHHPTAPAKHWLAAGLLAGVAFLSFLTFKPEAPVAFARLVAPYSGITFTRVENVTPDSTFTRDRLPRVEALVSGRTPREVRVSVSHPDGTRTEYPMNPLGDGRFELTLPAAEQSFEFTIRAGDSQGVTGFMECIDPAVFVASSADIEFPDYTGRPPVRQESADIEVVEGTRAVLNFRMSAPMASARLRLPGGKTVPLEIRGNDVSTTLDIAIGGDSAELTGTDARGHEMEPVQFTHKGFADELPSIEWLEPTKDIEATSVSEIPLRLRFKDDFGIASYGAVLQVRGESKEILSQSVEARDLRDLSEMTMAALESFPLTIRDNVRMYAWATDHKPRGEARAVSKLVSVDIRQFKRKWMMMEGVDGSGGEALPSAEDLVNLEKIVARQRVILSDSFPLVRNPAGSAAGLKDFAVLEENLGKDSAAFHRAVKNEGTWPADDLDLLAAAVSQMKESSAAWNANLGQAGFDRGDDALSSLLELRKNLLNILMKGKQQSLEPAKPAETPKPITDLAKEAERLAKEERDISNQLSVATGPDRLPPVQRQQDIVNSDAGELHARMMDHPEATPLVLSYMADAEKKIREATRETRATVIGQPPPSQLAIAAEALDAVARQLRALDEANMDETLAEMAAEAKKAAETAQSKDPEKKTGEDSGQQAGEKPGEKSGEQSGEKPGEQAAKGEGEKPGEGKGEGKSAQAAQGQGKGQGGSSPGQEGASKEGGEGSPGGTMPGDSAATAEDKPAGKDGEALAGNDPDAGNKTGIGEKAGTSSSDGPGATPGEAREGNADSQRKEALEKAARQAAANDDILKYFAERDKKAGKDSRIENLRKENGTETFEQKLNDVAAGKSDGGKTAGELKALAKALEQERELRRQSLLESLAKTREKAAELKKQAEEKRDAERKAAGELAKLNDGEPPSDPSKNGSEAAKQPGEGKGDGESDGNGEGKSANKNPGNKLVNGPGRSMGESTRDLAREMELLKDPELSRIAEELEKAAPDISSHKPLAAAERRLADMIEEISGLTRADSAEGEVFPAYRRAVEDYYRALSDDLGDEEGTQR